MRRKVIQVADSTALISLPMKWVKKYGIKKGDELEVEIEGRELRVKGEGGIELVEKEISIGKYQSMVNRVIHALYKKGVDVIKVELSSPSDVDRLQEAISQETVGYEIIEQGKSTCTIRAVASTLGDLDSLLRRLFLLQFSMGRECLEAIQESDISRLRQIRKYEETNNRLTTMCRRIINKESTTRTHIGPLYYIIEDFENLADEYKYMIDYLVKKGRDGKIVISKEVLGLFSDVNSMMQMWISLFNRFDEKLVVAIGAERKRLVTMAEALMEAGPDAVEARVIHHLSIAVQKIFCLVGPLLVMRM